MPLQPKRVKFRKQQRGWMRGVATRGSSLAFGEFGLKALSCHWLTGVQIEAARGDQVARERHDDLRRQRDACALDRHHQNDAAVAERGDGRDDEGGKAGDQFVDHFFDVLLS